MMTRDQICECCLFPKIEQEFSLCSPREELAYLGPGLALYLELIYLCFFIILGFSLCSTLPFILFLIFDNQYGTGEDILTSFSVFSVRQEIIFEFRSYTHFPVIVVIVLILKMINKQQWKTLGKCDDILLGPSDYTIMVQGLGKKYYTEKDIRELISTEISKINKKKMKENFLKVEKVVMTHDIRWKIKEYRRINRIIDNNKKQRVKRHLQNQHTMANVNLWNPFSTVQFEYKSNNPFESSKTVQLEQSQILRRDHTLHPSIECRGSPVHSPKKIMNSKKEPSCQYNVSGVVFVTFNLQEGVQLFENKYKMSTLFWLLQKLFLKLNFNISNQTIMFKNNLLKICRAPEPSEIIWENLGVSITEHIYRRFKGYIITFLMLLLSFVLVTSCTYLEQYSKTITNNQYIWMLIKSLKSLVIYVGNEIILYGLGRVTLYEKHQSIISFKASFCIKTFQVQCLNTIFLIPLSRFMMSDDSLESKENLVLDLWMLFFFLAFIQPMVELFNLNMLGHYLKKIFILKTNLKNLLTQKEANRLLEGPGINLPRKNAQLLLLIYFSLFYSAVIPLISFAAILGILLLYGSSKYCFLRRNSRPFYLGPDMNFIISEYLKFIPIHFVIAEIFFTELFLHREPFHEKLTNVNIICLGFAIILKIFPWKIFTRRKRRISRRKTVKHLAEKQYRDVCLEFENDYDRANPLTKKDALDLWVKELDAKRASTIKVIGRGQDQFDKLDQLKNFGLVLGSICHSSEESMMAYASDGLKDKIISNTTEAYHKYNLKAALWISRTSCQWEGDFYPKAEDIVGSARDRGFAADRLKGLENYPMKFINSIKNSE